MKRIHFAAIAGLALLLCAAVIAFWKLTRPLPQDARRDARLAAGPEVAAVRVTPTQARVSTRETIVRTAAPRPLDPTRQVVVTAPIRADQPWEAAPETPVPSFDELAATLRMAGAEHGEARLQAIRQLVANARPESPGDTTRVVAELRRLLGDNYAPVRAEALEGMVQLGADDAKAVVTEWLNDSSSDLDPVRHAAMRGAVRLGLTDQVVAIRKYLDSPDAFTRSTALTAIGALGDEASRPTLVQASRDSNTRVARSALRGLEYLDRFQATPGNVQ